MKAVRRSTQWPLFGRDDELSTLTETLLDRERGGGAALFGPAGAGKTRLATEVLSVAEERGMQPMRAVASRSAATIPLGALAPLLPDSLPEGSELRADVLRQVADAITAEAASGERSLLVVDDAHLLDDASATVVHQLAVLGKLTVLLTVRAGEPTPDPVLALWKDGLVHRFSIEHLSPIVVERLVSEVLGGPLDGATKHELWTASEGNPLLLRELVLGALESEQLIEDGGVWRLLSLPAAHPRLAELVDARLSELATDERELLEVVALGEPLGPRVLDELADTDALTRLEERGLVSLSSEGRRQLVRLAHPLYGEVLRQRVPRFRVMDINRGLADTVQAVGARRREDILRVALWRLDGGGVVHPSLMLEAAKQAHIAFEDDLAERLARAALEAGAGVPAGLLLGEILNTVGRNTEGERVLRSLESDSMHELERVQVRTSLASALFMNLGQTDEAIEVLQDLEQIAPEGPVRDEVIGFHGIIDLLSGHPRRAIEDVAGVLMSDQPRVVVQASIASGPALAICGETERALEVGRRAHKIHGELGYVQMLAKPWIHEITQTLAMAEAGQLADGHAIADAGYNASIERRERAAQAWFAMMLGRTAMLAGRVATANRWFAEGAAVFRELEHDGQRRWCLGGRALVTAWLGLPAPELLHEIEQGDRIPIKMLEPDIERARGWQAVASGDPDRGRAELRGAFDLAMDRGSYALASAALHDLVRLGEYDEPAAELAALAEKVDGALITARLGHADAARRGDGAGLAAASESFEALGTMLFAAEAAADAAAAFRRAGDQRKADTAERESARLAELCEGAATPALKGVGPIVPLTARQRDVALLAAKGLASKEIAKRLNVSARTVDNHLQQIYRKLGVANRADLADAVGVTPG